MISSTASSAPVAIEEQRRADGTVLLRNAIELPEIGETIPARLRRWARERPHACFLSQGERTLTYAQAEARRREIAAHILGIGADADRPLMIVADNGIEHALLVLAAMSVAVPVAIVSPSYVTAAARPWSKFHDIIRKIDPILIVSDACAAVERSVEDLPGRPDCEPLLDLSWLDRYDRAGDAEIDAAEKRVGLDTVAKLLFTSGSTALPKAVPNTQRMMVSNMCALEVIWPFLNEDAPDSVDWLPWNHTFGGNCCFNTTLWFGGHSHIDAGRPVPALFGKSVDALKRRRPNLYYNVPAGFALLLPYLEDDRDFAARFFGSVRSLFNAGAPLPDAIRARLESASLAAVGRTPDFVGGWGATETAPFSTVLYFVQPHAANLGLPIPGTTLKLVPVEDRYEVRVKGPNVMRGYWRDDVATAAAFDDEGYYRIGDAVKPADPDDFSQGLLFDGRVAENFKLASGTWVNVGALRLALISACEGLVADAVVTGEGRADLGLLIFPDEKSVRERLGETVVADGAEPSQPPFPALRAALTELLGRHNARQVGSSTRIGRFAVLQEPPSVSDGEITDKGYLNQRQVLARRSGIVAQLYAREADL